VKPDWRDMTLVELEDYLVRLRVSLTLLEKLGSRVALEARANAVARLVAELKLGHERVAAGDPCGLASTNKGTRRGKKDRVEQKLGRWGMVAGYIMDSGDVGEEGGGA